MSYNKFSNLLLLIFIFSLNSELSFSFDKTQNMALIPGGKTPIFYIDKKPDKISKPDKAEEKRVIIAPSRNIDSFWLDKYLVTNEDFLSFIKANPEWKKSKVKRIFADKSYLKNWTNDLTSKKSEHKSPVVSISWFAATAYCEWKGKHLPTTDQWELTLYDQNQNQEEIKKSILEWYSFPNPKSLPQVASSKPNGYSVYDLVGLVWEWTDDFNSFMISSDLRDSNDGSDGSGGDGMFCGGASVSASDTSNYATFMRYSFRASLKALYTTGNLGFRCALKISPNQKKE